MTETMATTLSLTAPCHQMNWSGIDPCSVTAPITLESDTTAVVPLSDTELRISLHGFGLRIRSRETAPDYGLMVQDPPAHPLALDQVEGHTQVTGGTFTLVLEHTPFAFKLFQNGRLVQQSATDGHFVRARRLPPFARFEDGWFLAFELEAEERLYGLGENWGTLDKRGQLVRSFNIDALGVNAEASYKNLPFLWSTKGWGVFTHTGAPVTHGVGHAQWSTRSYGLLLEDNALDVMIFVGDGASQIKTLHALTGHAPKPPLYSLGVILSKAYYQDAAEIISAARDVRERGMPCDTITFDGRAWQDTDTRFLFEWDPSRYPDPKQVVDALRAMDFRICVWEYPLVSTQNARYAELAQKGYFLRDASTGGIYHHEWDLEPFGEVLTPLPTSAMLDFTNPEAFAFWRDLHKPLFALGVDMIKVDFGEQVEDHALGAIGVRGQALHNIYGHLYNKCVYEAAERFNPKGAFLFSRAGWTASQRYPSQWGGDPQADWGGLAGSLKGALSWGLSGGPYFATDVGGFYGDTRDPILFVRWLQMAVFAAHIRLHGIGDRTPWSYGEDIGTIGLALLKLRYRLIPYLTKAIDQASLAGTPVQRAMVLAYPEDDAAHAFENQFMFGDDMLVAPCLNPEGRVHLYLPEGDWRRFPDGERFEGSKAYRLNLALDEMAVFVPEGVRIPLGEDVETTAHYADGEPKVVGYWPER